MKKAFNIFLLAAYLISTIGVTTSYAFCNDELQSVNLVLEIPDENRCACNSCCKDENSCCETEIKTTKIADSQNIVLQINLKLEKIAIATLGKNWSNSANRSIFKTLSYFNINPPPNENIILLNSSFLI